MGKLTSASSDNEFHFTQNGESNFQLVSSLIDRGLIDEVVKLYTKLTPLTPRAALQLLQRKIKESSDTTLFLNLLDKLKENYLVFNRIYSRLYIDLLNTAFSGSVEKITSTFEQYLAMENGAIIIFNWIETISDENNDKLVRIWMSLSQEKKDELVYPILKHAFKIQRLTFTIRMKTLFPTLYPKLLEENPTEANLNEFVMAIEHIKATDYQQFCMERLNAFNMGFGCIEHTDGLVALAAMIDKKHFSVIPTLLDNRPLDGIEIKRYVDALKSAPLPLCERFIISGDHWLSGQINIDESGHASLLMIDSLGMGVNGDDDDLMYAKDMVQQITSSFPQHTIYYSFEKRLNAAHGCSVFALDDLQHLYSLPRWLDKTKYPGGVFDYLRQNTVEKLTKDQSMLVHVARLPLHLVRTMQSKELLEIMLNHEDASLPLNRNGITGTFFANNQVGFIKKAPSSSQLQNARLNDKLTKMTQRILSYLLAHNFDTVKQTMHACGIEGFEQRIAKTPELTTPVMERGRYEK